MIGPASGPASNLKCERLGGCPVRQWTEGVPVFQFCSRGPEQNRPFGCRYSQHGSAPCSALLWAWLRLSVSGIPRWVRACSSAAIPDVRRVSIPGDAGAAGSDIRRARLRSPRLRCPGTPGLRTPRVCRTCGPICTRTAVLLDARRAGLERIRLVLPTGRSLQLSLLARRHIRKPKMRPARDRGGGRPTRARVKISCLRLTARRWSTDP
jgi:hypothetical protein